MPDIPERLKRIKGNIEDACQRTNRDPKDITLVVVTKNADIDSIKQVIQLGYTELGENRIAHLKQVSSEVGRFLKDNAADRSLPENVNWHMIGHLQRNKVKPVLKILSHIHSLDTLRLAEEINTAAEKLGIIPEVFLQVNCSEEPQKYGVPVGAATHLAEQLMTMPNIKLTGLMTMAPLTRDQNLVRSAFSRAKELFEEIKKQGHVSNDFRHLSMGMSQDYELAVELGATTLRIGSAIFAPDNPLA